MPERPRVARNDIDRPWSQSTAAHIEFRLLSAVRFVLRVRHRVMEQVMPRRSGQRNVVLDLFSATRDDVLRRVIGGFLREIRHVNLVRGNDMRASLLVIEALSTPELAFLDGSVGDVLHSL